TLTLEGRTPPSRSRALPQITMFAMAASGSPGGFAEGVECAASKRNTARPSSPKPGRQVPKVVEQHVRMTGAQALGVQPGGGAARGRARGAARRRVDRRVADEHRLLGRGSELAAEGEEARGVGLARRRVRGSPDAGEAVRDPEGAQQLAAQVPGLVREHGEV